MTRQLDKEPSTIETETSTNSGSNLFGVGQYNERLIIQLIRRAGSLPKAEIARITRLSAQTVSVIINRLLASKLLRKQPLQRARGRVGQPAMPIALNPDGAYSIGVKIGRRSLDILIVDFVGKVLHRVSQRYDYPDPASIFKRIEKDIAALTAQLSSAQRERIVGIGVAAPYALGGWKQWVGAPQSVLKAWNLIDIRERVSETQTLPVWFANDATAACIAELEFGTGTPWNDFLYFFVGTFIGGGTVINGSLSAGSKGNAGALGSMPVPAQYAGEPQPTEAVSVQLINCASRYLLDKQLQLAGFDADAIVETLGQGLTDPSTQEAKAIFDAWLKNAAEAMALAAIAAVSVNDFRGIVIDGSFPVAMVERLTRAVDKAISSLNLEGLNRPELVTGTIGYDARAIGGAVLPFYNNFAPDMNVLLKMELG